MDTDEVELFREVGRLAEAMRRQFTPPEFIPGCQVVDVADASEYATNNGWIEAICGQHNRQRVRWKSSDLISTASYIDVLYFPDRQIFETYGLGGSGAVPSSGGGWPFENVLTVSTTNVNADFDNLPDAITAAAAGDTILIDESGISVSATITINKALVIACLGTRKCVITSSVNSGPTLYPTADNVVLNNLLIRHTGAGTTSGCIATNNAGLVLDNCQVEKTSGAPSTAYGVWMFGGSVTLRNGTTISVTTGTTQYGIYNDTADATVAIEPGCEVGGATADVYGNRAGSAVTINGVLTSNLIDWAGTVRGRWENASGVQYAPESNDLFSAQTFRPNYIISPSVASNNLTVALKTMDGNDASAASPIVVRVGDAARVITAALSVTKNAGTNWCNSGSDELKTQDVDYFVYLIQESGASAGTKIGFSRIPYARTMGDFVNTTTSEKYIAGSWTNFNSTDPVEVIGRFNATLSASASYNWSIGTSVVINRPIYVSRWLSYTPTVTSQTGTITTVGAVAGQYVVDYNKLTYNHAGAITTNGTGATSVRISLPFTVVGDNTASPGVDSGLTGNMLLGQNAGQTINWFTYNGGYPGGSGANVKGGGVSMRLA